MHTEQYRPTVEYLQNRAGDTLRAVVVYDEEEWETPYVRGDVRTDDLRDWLATYVDHLRDQTPSMPTEEYGLLGDTQATIELHERGVLLHLQRSETEGVAISMEREMARDLAEFVAECRRRIEDGGD